MKNIWETMAEEEFEPGPQYEMMKDIAAGVRNGRIVTGSRSLDIYIATYVFSIRGMDLEKIMKTIPHKDDEMEFFQDAIKRLQFEILSESGCVY